MSLSLIVLTALIFIVMFGFGDRILDKLRLSDRTALIVLILIVIGIIIPPINISPYFGFSIGGFLIPLILCIYLLVKVGYSRDLVRAIIGTIITAGVIIGVQYLLPADPEEMIVDPIFIYGLIAGLVAYILGRSRRNSFICAVLGITLSKLIMWIINICLGVKEYLGLGVSGAFDTLIIGCLFAVGFSMVFGEIMEKTFPDKKQKVLGRDGRFKHKSGKI